jgi:hypothetical protein
MGFSQLVKAAIDLGVIPALALFLVAAMFVQNRQLIKDRREVEARLLDTITQILSDYKELLARLYGQDPEGKE